MHLSIQQEQKEKLEQNNVMSFKEIMDIVEAFQIASGQSFAIGKTIAILDFLKKGNSIVIQNFDNTGEVIVVFSVTELANIFKSIDKFVDLESDKEFKSFF